MVVTDFLVLKERTDFDLNKETTEYFSFEFEKNTEIPVSRVDVVPESVETFEQEDFWTDLPTEKENADTLTDEQTAKLAADAQIDPANLAIFLNGYALHCKRVS